MLSFSVKSKEIQGIIKKPITKGLRLLNLKIKNKLTKKNNSKKEIKITKLNKKINKVTTSPQNDASFIKKRFFHHLEFE